MNPIEIVKLRDDILQLHADRMVSEIEIEGFQAQTVKGLEGIKSKRDSNLQGELDKGNASIEQIQRAYSHQCNKVVAARESDMKLIEENIKTAKETYLKGHDHLLSPLRNFSGFDVERKLDDVTLPNLNTIEDILAFNQDLDTITELSDTGEVKSHADKAVWILKPSEYLVGMMGEDKRKWIEFGYIGVLAAACSVWGAYILPVGVGATTIYGVRRYKVSSHINNHWETYHQAKNYRSEILDKMKKVLLASNKDTIDKYREDSSDKINSNHPMPPKPGDTELKVNDAQINEVFIQETNAYNVSRKAAKEGLLRSLDTITANLKDRTGKMNKYVDDCKENSWSIDNSSSLPEYAHLGTIKNETFDIHYPYMHKVIENSLCIYYDISSRRSVVDFLKYYMMQLWTNVEPTVVRYRLIDTKDFGAEFSDILVSSEELIDLTTESSKTTELLTEATDELKKRNIDILRRFKNIAEYNKAMEEQDAALASYDIYININPTKEQLLSTQNKSLIKQASDCGIFIINLVSDTVLHAEERDTEELTEVLHGHGEMIIFEEDNIIEGLSLGEDETFSTIRIPKQNYVEVADRLNQEVEDAGIKTLWFHDLMERNFPERWNKIPEEDIEFCIGNLNGERDKPSTLLLGDTNPHALLAGATGQGKSVLLNSMLLSIAQMYSPDWVQMYLLDFKGTEMLFYGKPHALPHLRTVSATRDINYVMSIFNDILGEMEARNKMFDSVLGIKNYREFCAKMQKKGGPEEIWAQINDPNGKNLQTLGRTAQGKRIIESMTTNKKYPVLPRILFCIDEFADMFLIGDDFKDQVSKLISSLAKKSRSAGIHMVFASQNMEGTVPENVLEQFKLRICVPCSAGVSSALIGNREASVIKRGYAIANNEPDQKDKYNELIKVAYEHTPEILDIIEDMAKERPIDVPIYDEAVIYNYKHFLEHINRFKKVRESNTYILGEPRVYQRVNMPVAMSVKFRERENINIMAMDKDEMNGLTTCLLDNMKHKKVKILMQTADEEYNCSKEWLGDVCIDYIIDIQTKYMYEFLEANLEARQDSGNRAPVYVVLHDLQSMVGFGVDGGLNDLQEFLKDNMLDLNSVGIYFVLCTTTVKSVRQLHPSTAHLIVGNLEERDLSFAPDLVYKTLRNISENEAYYINTTSSKVKAFKPYIVYESVEVDEGALFR